MTDAIRRMIDLGKAATYEGVPGADRAWRLGLARAARDCLGLDLDLRKSSVQRQGLAEVLEQTPDRALIAVLDGPKGGLGVVMVSADVTAAAIEIQTLGRLSPQPAAARKPTRIDAAMLAGLIDRALANLEDGLSGDDDRSWAGGFRYASFLEDARPLALLLEEDTYRLLHAEVSFAEGARRGDVLLALPAEGKAEEQGPDVVPTEDEAQLFSALLAGEVMQAESRLCAILGRMTLPIRQIMSLAEGDVLPLSQAGLDALALETLDGRCVALGRLGQHRGQRALKLTEVRQAPVVPFAATLASAEIEHPPLRATG